MSSFLDSTGLSRLVSKITDYFCKKNGSYADLTAGKVAVQDSAEGIQRDMLCVDSDGKLRKAKNFSTYSDSNNGSFITLGTSDRRGVIRLYDNAGHYSSLRTSQNVGASDTVFILGKPGVIPSKSNNGSDLGGVGTPIYMKSGGQLALCTPSDMTVGTANSLSGYLKRYVSHGYMGQQKKAFRIFVFSLNDYTSTGNTDETFYPEIHFVRSAQEDIVTKLRIRVRNLNNTYTCTASVISRSEQLPAGYSIVLKFTKFDTNIGYYLSIVNKTGDYWCGYVAYMDAPIDHTGNIGSAIVTTYTNPAGADSPSGQYEVTIS